MSDRAETNRRQRTEQPRRGVPYTGEKPHMMKTTLRLLSYVKNGYALHFIVVIITLILASLGQVAGTYLMRYLIDDYITPFIGMDHPEMSLLFLIIGAMGLAYVVSIVSTYIYNRLMVTVSQGIMKTIRDEMFEHMETLPLKYFDSNSKGDLMSRYTNDTDTLRMFLSQGMTQIVSAIITAVSVFVSMLTLSIPLTGIVVILLIVMMVMTQKISKLSARYFGAQQKSLGDVNGYIEEMITGQKVIKVFNHEEAAKKVFDQKNEELYQNARKANIMVNVHHAGYGSAWKSDLSGGSNCRCGYCSIRFCGDYPWYSGILPDLYQEPDHADHHDFPAAEHHDHGTCRCRAYL